MYLGIDVGTSAVKALIIDDTGRVRAQSHAPLSLSRPHSLWSEQDPAQWWEATQVAVSHLDGSIRQAVRAIGLTGQMHGATLLDDGDRVLRPAILWNDGRSYAQCRQLEDTAPDSRHITGNVAMPGFTAPKLLWVHENEPTVFRQVRRVLLPKDYIRLRLTGDHATDVSDAAGTLWLDVARRQWSSQMLEATHLDERHMPRLFEGTEFSGTLHRGIAASLGLPPVAVAAGGGDNAAGAVGVGVIDAGQALMSLGTSGVIFTADDAFRPNPARAMHAFCHCLPRRWHEMSVTLSAASCIDWVARLAGYADAATALADAEHSATISGSEIFLPYLSGERTPHNNPQAEGVFFGLTHDTTPANLVRSVLEGVAFAMADGADALRDAGASLQRLSVIGGGSRSNYWGKILAAALRIPLDYRAGSELGPAHGAARLARLAFTNELPSQVCLPPPVDRIIEPDPALAEILERKQASYRRIYAQLESVFPRAPPA